MARKQHTGADSPSRLPAILVNGEDRGWVSASDRGLQYGDGLFETIAVYKGAPLLWAQHMARLAKGCGRLGLGPPDEDILRDEAAALCGKTERGILKIIITRGDSARGYRTMNTAPTRIISLSPWPNYPDSCAGKGVDVRICVTRLGRNSRLAGVKHLNRLEQVLARAEWGDEYAEGLMLDDLGNVIEGVMSNLFLAADGALITPDLSHAGVEGVMRGRVMEEARALNIACHVEDIAVERLRDAQETFLTNSVIGVWPVKSLEGRGLRIGNLTRVIQQAVAENHCYGR